MPVAADVERERPGIHRLDARVRAERERARAARGDRRREGIAVDAQVAVGGGRGTRKVHVRVREARGLVVRRERAVRDDHAAAQRVVARELQRSRTRLHEPRREVQAGERQRAAGDGDDVVRRERGRGDERAALFDHEVRAVRHRRERLLRPIAADLERRAALDGDGGCRAARQVRRRGDGERAFLHRVAARERAALGEDERARALLDERPARRAGQIVNVDRDRLRAGGRVDRAAVGADLELAAAAEGVDEVGIVAGTHAHERAAVEDELIRGIACVHAVDLQRAARVDAQHAHAGRLVADDELAGVGGGEAELAAILDGDRAGALLGREDGKGLALPHAAARDRERAHAAGIAPDAAPVRAVDGAAGEDHRARAIRAHLKLCHVQFAARHLNGTAAARHRADLSGRARYRQLAARNLQVAVLAAFGTRMEEVDRLLHAVGEENRAARVVDGRVARPRQRPALPVGGGVPASRTRIRPVHVRAERAERRRHGGHHKHLMHFPDSFL